MTPRRIVALLLLGFLASWAFVPLRRAGFLGDDHRMLVEVGRLAWPSHHGREALEVEDLYALEHEGVRPLAAMSLAWSARFAAPGGLWDRHALRLLRAENLLMLALGAWALGRFVRRALEPWTGRDQAGAAGLAVAVLCVLHPFGVAVVAEPAGRGPLLGFLFGTLACATFLRGRQARQPGQQVLAGACAVLCGLASESALFLPFALAAAEFASARRGRRLVVRLRTAGTTAVVYGACVTLEGLLRATVGGPWRMPAALEGLAAALDAERLPDVLGLAAEKVGLLLLPVHPHGLGTAGVALAAVLALVALQPALVAARSAPRTWGWLLAAWAAGVVLAQLSTAGERVTPGDPSRGAALFAGSIVMCTGLGIAATALSGTRRRLLPWGLGLGYAVLAHAAARTRVPAAEAVAELRSDLYRARAELRGPGGRILVLEPPGRVAGVDALGGGLRALLDPAFAPPPGAHDPGTGDEGAATRAASPPAVRALSRSAFLALAQEPELDALRRQPLVVLLPPEAPGVARLPVAVPPPDPTRGPTIWRREGRSPGLDVDPFGARAVRATALPGTPTSSPPRLFWRARADAFELGELEGVWVSGDDGPVATFDTARLPWFLSSRVLRVGFEGGLASLVSAEVLPEAAPLSGVAGLVPRRVRGELALDLAAAGLDHERLPEPIDGAPVAFELALLDTTAWEAARFPAAKPGVLPVLDGPLAFPGAARWLAAEDRGPVAVRLELVAADTVLARARERWQVPFLPPE